MNWCCGFLFNRASGWEMLWYGHATKPEHEPECRSEEDKVAPRNLPYLVFEAAFFFRSAHRFFISSDNLLRPAAVRWRPGFAVVRFMCATLTLPLT